MANIVFTYTAEGKQLATENEKMKKQIQSLREEFGSTGRAGKNAFGSIGKEVNSVLASLTGPLGIAASVLSLVNSVKAAYAEMKEEQRKFLGNMQTEAQAKANFLYNAGSMPGGKAAAEALVGRVSANAGIDKARAYSIGATAISAAGAASLPAIENAMTEAGRLERLGLGRGETLAGGALDIAKATGGEDAAANFAFIRQVGGAARTVTLEAQSNLTSGILAAVQAKATPEEAAELSAALNNLGTDPEGRKTSTTMVRLMQALQSDELVPGKGDKWSRLTAATPMARIAEMQGVWSNADVGQRAKIMEKIGGEGQLVPAMQEMFGNTPMWRDTITSMQEKITAPGSPQAMAQWKAFREATSTGMDAIVEAGLDLDAANKADAGSTRADEAARRKAIDSTREWMGRQGILQKVVAANPARELWTPEQWRDSAIRATPEEDRNTEQFTRFFAALDKMIGLYRGEDAAKAIEALNRNTDALQKSSSKENDILAPREREKGVSQETD